MYGDLRSDVPSCTKPSSRCYDRLGLQGACKGRHSWVKTVPERRSQPVEGGSANDYDYTYGDPINGLDLNGECAQLWRKKCRDKQVDRLKGAGGATGRWVYYNRWKIAGLASIPIS